MSLVWRSHVVPDDLEHIRVIVTDSSVFSAEEIGIAVELAQDRLTRGPASEYHFLFAIKDGQTLAYSCFGRIPFTDERYDLYWIASAKQAQGKGIAAKLLSETEAAIRTLGGKKLYAETSSREVYAAAHRFYAATGFTEIARLTGFYSDSDDKIMFAKSL